MNSLLQYEDFPIAEGLPAEAVDELSIMMRAAYRAGDIARAGYNELQAIREKGYGNLFSRVDFDCDEAIHDEMQKARPGQTILSEEKNPNADISKGKATVVDPLDASSAFLFSAGEDMPSIMLARTEDGEATSAVVYFPLTDEMFYAVKGLGAYKAKQRLHCSATPMAESWVEMNQQANSSKESEIFSRARTCLRLPGGPRMVSSSPPHSGIGVRIAEGRKRLAAVIHDNNPGEPQDAKQAPWDVIPVKLILEEAGGVVLNMQKQPYNPFKPEPFVMAVSEEFAYAIIDRIN